MPWRRLAGVALLLASAAAGWLFATRTPRVDAGTLIAASEAAMGAGQVSQARRLANRAVAIDPTRADAHLAAARGALAEGDGLTAEGEIGRAIDAGAAADGTRHLLAHARLLQDDPRGAIDLARRVGARDWIYARRVEARALAATGDPAAAQAVWVAAIARDTGDSALWSDVARFRIAIGDEAGAIAASAHAVALDPANLDALIVRARTARSRGGPRAALRWHEAALARDPYSYTALIDTAATLGEMGRARAMLTTTRRALAVRPADPQAFALLATLAVRAGRAELARELFDRVGNRLDSVPAGLLVGAALDIDGGANERAVARLRNLLGLQPMNIRARQLLALALLRLDGTRDALDVLRPIALREDADSYTLILSARAFERIGDRVEAARLLDRAAALVPGPAAVFAPDDSLTVLAAAADAGRPGDPATTIPYVRALIDAGAAADAATAAGGVARANPASSTAWLAYGDALRFAGRGESAMAYARAAALRWDTPALLRLGTNDAARRYLAGSPRDTAALRLFARTALATGQGAAAVPALVALRAQLGDRDAAVLIGQASAGGPAAVDAATRAYRLAPANPFAVGLFGAARAALGDGDGAAQLRRKAAMLAAGGG